VKKIIITLSLLLFISSLVLPVYHSQSEPLYPVTFTETGLPNGTVWSIALGNDLKRSTGSIDFYEPNGSYNFTLRGISGYQTEKYLLEVNVTGSPVNVTVSWQVKLYKISFFETGLRNGLQWGIIFESRYYNTSKSYISFEEPNGTYIFYPQNATGYAPESNKVAAQIDGYNMSITVKYVPIMNITFFMNGLESGQDWSVTIGNKTFYSNSPFISISIKNGSYGYQIHLPANYYAEPSQGFINASNDFIFVNAYSYVPWEILIVIIVLLDVILFIFLIRKRHLKKK